MPLLTALLNNVGVSNESLPPIRKFKSVQKAKKALSSVFATKSVGDFHKLLFSYKSPYRDCPKIQLASTREEFLTEKTQWAKGLNRKKVMNFAHDAEVVLRCATDPECCHCKRPNPRKRNSGLHACPCGKVVYCPKDCQKICTARKK
mmetsp:Transcript_23814/g.56223  ORF Transcript_23814/g.56223 Transcript_23814/m.56223 type:complete len:147 (-) Transcript_23814:2259-2699(-)